ncbi:unnamed protein product [Mytilus coruscus]|uniref:Uncharacterized protein n=1 Tax=Mytilus coruscus TaxID=42192 RepID=A0A6J8B407_MYTCO|nr:unnamed protein product [Mytilus coruscus]
MFRYQVESFMRSHRSPGVACFDNDFKEIISVILESADITVSRDCNENLEGDIQDFKVWSSFLEQKDRFSMMLQGVQVEFNEWRKQSNEQSETFRYWDNFIGVDFMEYLGLYLAIREQNWDLRNASLKNLACLFTAFDKHYYSDSLSLCRSTYIPTRCLALDEAHEMEINLKTKKAINTFSLPSLTAMTYYLPYRAVTLHNLKVKLDIESGQSGKRKELSKSYIHSEEQTIFQYVEKLKVSSLFVDDLVCNLHLIFTHTTATRDQADSLLRSRYPDAFLSAFPTETGLTAVILEGMFMINSNPAPQHKTFGDYTKNVVFDHPNRHGCSPKDVERSRRDSSVQATDSAVLSSVVHEGLLLPSSWRSFLANREYKRNLVNFLSYELLRLALSFFIDGLCTVITAGGFDDNRDKSLGISSLYVGIVEFAQLSANHEEGDTRVWLHAS